MLRAVLPRLVRSPVLLWLVAAPAAAQADEYEVFERDVRPLLVERCYRCHSEESGKQRGGLLLDRRSGWAVGGDSGPALVPGKPEQSRLMQAVRHEGELEMPPSGRLDEREIEVLQRWIASGAPDPRVDEIPADTRREIDLVAGRRFWSFRPLADVEVPAPDDARWPRGDVDRFLLASMEERALVPAGDASKASWLRRVTFTLTGLPPEPAEIGAFARDCEPGARERVVDRLLASRAYAERFARHWLDVARFAESSGGGRSLMFPDAWRYRDWVVRAVEDDLAFERFVTEQIAGDLLPWDDAEQRNRQVTAVGFLALGATNYEQQDKELLRLDVIDEQIDTVGRAFLGMTLGCARCHDHKFDPIPTTDYYALAGVFGSTQSLTPGNVSGWVREELLGPELDTWRAHRERDRELRAQLRRSREGLKAVETRPLRRSDLQGIVLDDTDATLIGEWKASTHVQAYVEDGYLHDQAAGKGQRSVTFVASLPRAARYEIRLGYAAGANRAPRVPVTIESVGGSTTVYVDQRQTPPIMGVFTSLGVFELGQGETIVRISNAETRAHVIADAVWIVPEGAEHGVDPEDAETRQRALELEASLEALAAEQPPEPPRAMSVRDLSEPADERVRIRGSVRQLGAEVPRGFLSVCSEDGAAIPPGRSGRLELARWLASPSHPLTARVYVNRVWLHVFGAGLVRTADNFGAMGEAPSHPELLDWLARRFVEQGGSTRRLIRELVLSRAFGLEVVDTDSRDPENRLLASAHRRRLDAESLRDAILTVSGELDRTSFGSTIRKVTQYDHGQVFDTRRRSLYVPRFRNTPLDLFAVFDVANPNVPTGVRSVTQVAPQELYLLNSPWVRGQARHAARRLLGDLAGSSERERLVESYRRSLGREPDERELRVAASHLGGDVGVEPWTDLFHAQFVSLGFRYLE